MRVAFASHTSIHSPFRVGSHHLARELARRGVRVCHISTPISPLTVVGKHRDPETWGRVRAALSRHGQVVDDVLHLTPVSALPLTAVGPRLRHLSLDQSAPRLLRVLRAHGMSDVDVLLVDQPAFAGLDASLTPRVLVYRPTDLVHSRSLVAAQAELLSRADAVIATSTQVLSALPEGLRGSPRAVLENGVELRRFACTPPWSERSGAVYVGALDARFDWEALIAIAVANPQDEVRVAGPIAGKPPSLPHNVRLLGAVQYEQIPDLVARARVGLLPLKDSPANVGRSPMKYYEYLASGLRLVARGLASLADRQHAGVHLYTDVSEAGQLARVAMRALEPNVAGRAEAGAYDWSDRAARLHEMLGPILARQRISAS